MKKRFLSAALALAMVLTLLPLSVMPASAAGEGADAYYHVEDNDFASGDSNAKAEMATGWYTWTINTAEGVDKGKRTYTSVGTSGIVTSVATDNGATAKWYSALETVTVDGKEITVKPAYFTVLDSKATISNLDWTISDARLNGNTLEITKFADKNQNITVRDGRNAGLTRGTLALPSTHLTGYTLTLNVTNAMVGGFTVENGTNANGAVVYNGGGTVTLTDCTLQGNIVMPKGTLTLTRTTSVHSISMGTRAASQGGTVSLNWNSIISSVNMFGPSTLSIKDTSNAGTVTLFGGSKDDVPANTGKAEDQKVNPSWAGTTVNLSQSGRASSITCNSSDMTKNTINADSNAFTGDISLNYGNVTLTGAGSGTVAVKVGDVKLSDSASASGITLGDADLKGKCTLDISGANTVVSGKVDTSAVAPANLTVRISGGRFTDKTDGVVLGSTYQGGGITGGTFSKKITTAAWLGNVTYQIQRGAKDSETFTYTNSLAEAVSAYTDDPENNKISIVGSTDNAVEIKFVLDDNAKPAFVLGADVNTRVLLPAAIGKRSVSKWYNGDIPYDVNDYFPVSVAAILRATSTENDLGTINGVTATVKGDIKSPNLTASLVGNTIKLEGAVNLNGNNYAIIELVFTTTTNTDKSKITIEATYYDTNPKSVLFTGSADGLSVTNGNKEVSLKGSNTKFTVDCSGLRRLENVEATDVAKTQVVNVTDSSLGAAEKANLIDALKTVEFDYKTAGRALEQALNKALASYTASSIQSAITNGKSAYAREHNLKTNDPSIPAFDTVKIQVYLDIKVTKVVRSGAGTDGSITLDITPMYHEVLSVGGDKEYVNPAAKSLDSALLKSTNGEYGITIKLPTSAPQIFNSTTLWAHHGDYVYKLDGDKFTNLHGFSSFTISAVGPVASVNKIVRNGAVTTDGAPFYYDSLAAAVADVANDGTVTVNAGYRGVTSIPVNGSARQFTVNNTANAGTALTFTGANVVSDGKNDKYTVELTRDTVSAQGNVVVNNVTGGTASATPNPATAGQTVTITLTAQTGYVANGVTVQDANGRAVSVNGAGTTYTFVMPAGSVTVTPAFIVGDGKAAFEYNTNTNQGTVQAITATEDGKVEQGTAVLVLVSPKSGYRTIGLTARGNNGASAAVTRTGVNSFNVTVPVGASVVTLTPTFDLDTNTPFADVLSSHWASKYVTWAYQTKYFEGTGTYTFAPANYITRGEVVAALWKADGKQIVNYPNPFKDVPTNYWAYDAVMWAASKGLIDTSTGYFAPMGYASRAEVVTILYKRANSPAVYGTSGFADVASNATYAKAVTWARQNKLTNGYGGNTYFRPAYAISRAEVAAFLSRAFGGPA